MKKRKYLKLRGEDTMVTIIVISIVGLLVTSFIGQAVLQSSNSELQRLKSKIETQEELNEEEKSTKTMISSNEANQ
jgi:cell division protein FtsL